MSPRVVRGRPPARGHVRDDPATPDHHDNESTGQPLASADRPPGHAFRILGKIAAGSGLALFATAFLLPFAVPFETLIVAWWIVVGAAAVSVTLAIVSATSVRRFRDSDEPLPLRRDDPDELDFDAPWHTEADT